MLVRAIGIFMLMGAVVPAQAQWQPLDGGGGGVPATAPNVPSSPAPSAPAAAPPPSGWGAGIQGWGAPVPSSGTSAGSGGSTVTPSVAPAAGGMGGGSSIEITYSGQAAQDPRTATMRLSISGNQITAHVSMQSICGQNVRVGGADIDLVGTLGGAWESQGGRMAGSWTGTDHHCGSDDPNQGQFEFFMKEGWGGKPLLHLRVTGKNGRYGWNFVPKGKDFTSNAGGGGTPTVFGAAGGFDSPVGPPRSGFRIGVAAPAFAAQSYADRMRQFCSSGTIVLRIGESRMVGLPSAENMGAGYDADFNRISAPPSCVTTANRKYILTPGSVATTAQVGSAIRVTARGQGKGELWMETIVRCRKTNGESYEAKVVSIYNVLVGDAAVRDYQGPQAGGNQPPMPPGDIGQAVVSGVARMVDTGEPVAGATVTLVRPQGGAVQDASWITGADGSFRIVAGADKNLRSGRYEVMVQKLRMPEVPGRCSMRPGTPAGIGIDCDLWPVGDYFVTLSRDAPNASVGQINMNFLRYIPARGGGTESGTKGAVFPNIVPYPRADSATPVPDQGQNQASQWQNRFR